MGDFAARETVTLACPDCGSLQELPELHSPAAAVCIRCGRLLERTNGRSVRAALACSAGAFVLLIPANVLPLMHVSMLGMTRTSRIASGVQVLWNGHWVIVAALVCVCAIVLPLVRFAMLTAVLALVMVAAHPPGLGRLFRWSLALDPWAMPDVFLIGGAIGYSRVAAALPVSVDAGGVCLILAAVLGMLARATLEPRIVWQAIGAQPARVAENERYLDCAGCGLLQPAPMHLRPCPRCGLRITARKPDSVRRTLALVIAGLALYFPANFLPMSTDMQLGQPIEHRIVDGIRELFQAGLWPLGVLIFCTSVTIPLLKLAGLGWFMLSIRHGSARHLARKTRLYRLIDEIGRWSNVDVFTIAVFAPLLRFGALATAGAAPGATAFILVVTTTMLASRVFDPRLMWDAGLAERS